MATRMLLTSRLFDWLARGSDFDSERLDSRWFARDKVSLVLSLASFASFNPHFTGQLNLPVSEKNWALARTQKVAEHLQDSLRCQSGGLLRSAESTGGHLSFTKSLKSV